MRHLARVQSASAHGSAQESGELTRFCTHCATLFDGPPLLGDRPLRGRVCGSCSLGVVLTCTADLLTGPGEAFLIVTADLRVSAASEAAEHLFHVPDGTFGRPLLSLMTSPDGIEELSRRVASAATGSQGSSTMRVEPAASRLPAGVLEARIGSCGDPPAALVVLEPAVR
jgi:hypothetical protein